LKILLELS